MKYCLIIVIFVILQCKNPNSITEKNTEFATGFSILENSSNQTVMTDSLNRKITIKHDKTEVDKNDLFTIKSPVKKVVCGTSKVAALLGPIAEHKSIKGVTLAQDQWYINSIKNRIKSDQIMVLGNGMSGFNIEGIIKLSPDIVFTSSDYEQSRAAILKKRKIKSAIVHEYYEDSYLGQFEWIKFLAFFYNKGKLADEIFNYIKKSYYSIKAVACNSKKRPAIAWGNLYEGQAFVPGGNSTVAHAISDAGGDYLMNDFKGSGSLPISLEKFFSSYINSEIFIYSSTRDYGSRSVKQLIAKSEILARFKSIKKGNVWCFKPVYWQAVDRPDLILKDIASIIHPELFPDHKLKFFEKMPME